VPLADRRSGPVDDVAGEGALVTKPVAAAVEIVQRHDPAEAGIPSGVGRGILGEVPDRLKRCRDADRDEDAPPRSGHAAILPDRRAHAG
jgi:hypothetical protein